MAEERAEELMWPAVADAFLKRHCVKLASGAEMANMLRLFVTPKWKNKRLDEIDTADINRILDAVEERGVGPGRINRVLATVRKLFNWAIARGLIKYSPVVKGMARREVSRDRFLSFDEVRQVWRALETIGGPLADCARVMLLTGQREGEVSHMLRDAVDTAGVWKLTADETKAAREHLVPLPEMALQIVKAQPLLTDDKGKLCPFVFTYGGNHEVRGFGALKRRLDGMLPFTNWRFHDLRRTCATHLADLLGFAPHIVGSVLNHSPKTHMGITHVYARGDLVHERRAALNAWSRLLQTVLDAETWIALTRHLQDREGEAGEMSYQRREEFRRLVRSDRASWQSYLAGLTATGDNVVRLEKAG